MKSYKMTVNIPEPYRKHVNTLKKITRAKNIDELIRQIIDEKMHSMFSN